MERGTYFPFPVSVKKVSKEPPSARSFASGSGRPSALSPCSSRYLRWRGQLVVLFQKWICRTTPRHCCPAGCRPGRCGGGRSVVHNPMSVPNFDHTRGCAMAWTGLLKLRDNAPLLAWCSREHCIKQTWAGIYAWKSGVLGLVGAGRRSTSGVRSIVALLVGQPCLVGKREARTTATQGSST
jgi:hypothetical protein